DGPRVGEDRAERGPAAELAVTDVEDLSGLDHDASERAVLPRQADLEPLARERERVEQIDDPGLAEPALEHRRWRGERGLEQLRQPADRLARPVGLGPPHDREPHPGIA